MNNSKECPAKRAEKLFSKNYLDINCKVKMTDEEMVEFKAGRGIKVTWADEKA